LQYAFIEFENQKDCEQAYFKMQGVLIDDHRIHVDFSQSVGVLAHAPPEDIADYSRLQNSLTVGDRQLCQSVLAREAALVGYLAWRRNGNIERSMSLVSEMVTEWFLIEMRCAGDPSSMKPIDHLNMIGLAVGVRGRGIRAMIDITTSDMTGGLETAATRPTVVGIRGSDGAKTTIIVVLTV
jgi:hypothetical protein